MLKKRWLNAVRMLSVCHPCLAGDVWRCQRWPGQRLFHVALCGSVLIESDHGLSSGGYMCDVVLSGRTMVECDSISPSFPPVNSPLIPHHPVIVDCLYVAIMASPATDSAVAVSTSIPHSLAMFDLFDNHPFTSTPCTIPPMHLWYVMSIFRLHTNHSFFIRPSQVKLQRRKAHTVRVHLRPGMCYILVLTGLRHICGMGTQGDRSLLDAWAEMR